MTGRVPMEQAKLAHSVNETPTSSAAEARLVAYQYVIASGLIILLVVTWPLWLTVDRFPAIPTVSWLVAVPPQLDWALAAVLTAALLSILLFGRLRNVTRGLWLLVAAVLVLEFLLNQHRFQPWAYQAAVMAIFFGQSRPRLALSLARVVVLSVYFYSAVSKLNASFAQELGADLLRQIAHLTSGTIQLDWMQDWVWLALLMPAFELIVFALLIMRGSRRAGVIAAVSMHIGLVLILGPWGWNHSAGVLLWNVLFAIQAVLLFWPSEESVAKPEDPPSTPPIPSRELSVRAEASSRFAVFVCWFVVIAPMLEPLGLLDPWPGWALYASHVGRARLFVPVPTIDELPPPLKAYVLDQDSENLFVPINISRLSLDRTGAPIYPGTRFEFAAAAALARNAGISDRCRIVLESPADRFLDHRESQVVSGVGNIDQARGQFWLNTQPREVFQQQAD